MHNYIKVVVLLLIKTWEEMRYKYKGEKFKR